MSAGEKIRKYYDGIAAIYDTDRFGNSYGQYINAQERAVLEKLIPDRAGRQVLDLGCGTGRFLDHADCGVDLSGPMIAEAARKYPDTPLFVEDASATHFDDAAFDRIFSFHLLMHLDRDKTRAIFSEAHRLLPPGGRFIFDVPSGRRRRRLGNRQKGWHGANDFTIGEIEALIGAQWRITSVTGVLFLPVHRIPARLRPWLTGLDNLLCRSFMKEYASYLVMEVER